MIPEEPSHGDGPVEHSGEEVVDLGPPIVSRDLQVELKKYALPSVRWRLAIALLLVISAVIAGAGVMIGLDSLTAEEARDLLPMALTPLFTLLATVVGFYFKDGNSGS